MPLPALCTFQPSSVPWRPVRVAGQTAPAENGVYPAPAGGAATRHTDFDAGDDLVSAYFPVSEGTTNADTLWRSKADKGGTLGSTAVTIEKFASGIAAATQAEQEAASSTTAAVTPGRQQFHPSALKGWGRADSAGAVVVSYNLASVTDNGTGDITWTWATDFSGANYAAICGFVAPTTVRISCVDTTAAGTTRCVIYTTAQVASDVTNHTIMVAGDQGR